MKSLSTLAAPLVGVIAFITLAAFLVLYMTDVGVNIMFAIIEAVTPPSG